MSPLQGGFEITELLVLTGPESCGKTTLAERLSRSLVAPLVPEVARDYLVHKMDNDSHFQYDEKDLLKIARQQVDAESRSLVSSPDILVCDTDLLVLIVWSEVRFGFCHSWILNSFDSLLESHNRHYLLCDTDVPWEHDPLRESADSREELFQLYIQKLDHYGLKYDVVSGTETQREARAINLIQKKITTH